MKRYLTKRTEVAEAINFGRTPVLRIDLETPKAGWDDNFIGDRVLVSVNGSGNREDCIRCQLHKFGDEPNRYTLMPENMFITNSFGYADAAEMVAWAQAPTIKAGETVIVFEDYPKARECKVHVMRVSDNVGKHVYPTCYLEEVE